jgi:OOP family OmpA-OmpF porin
MKKVYALVCASALLLGWGGIAAAHQTLGAHIKCQDSFVFVVDYSGSMMMTHKLYKEEKINVAKQAIAKINAKLPNLAYQAGLVTFAPNSTVVPTGAWDRAAMNKGIWTIRSGQAIYGRMTPMANGLSSGSAAAGALPGKKAVILLSDGESNLGANPVASAQALYAANPNAVIHIVSLADTKKGAATLASIAALKPGSVLVDATEVVAVEELADDFVKKVFCYEATDVKDMVVLRSVHFAVGSYKLDKIATAKLDAYAAVLKTRPSEKVLIRGWADVTGRKDKNLTLSQNRAHAVKQYLEKAGVKNRIFLEDGRGVSYDYDNRTVEGRYMNRRAEINIVNP